MKFVNDAPKRFVNCIVKPMVIDTVPHLVLFAAKRINPGMELRYDYGGGDLPWRKVSKH